MKVAVFCLSALEEECAALSDALRELGAEVVICAENAAVFDAFVFPHASLRHTTHCVLLDWNATPALRSYAFGFSVGKNCPLLALSDNAAIKCRDDEPFGDDDFSYTILPFRARDELIAYFKKQKIDFDARMDARAAKKQLVERGIPAHADFLFFAALDGDKDVADLFFRAGFTPDQRNREGLPLLCAVTRERRCDMAEYLIERGADINAASSDRGYTALMDAVAMRQEDLASRLLERGADVNVQGVDGQTALTLAVCNNDAPMVSSLLSKNADPELRDKLNMSARDYARLFHNPEITVLFGL